MKRLRCRAVLKWTGVGLCTLICVVWVEGGWYWAWHVSTRAPAASWDWAITSRWPSPDTEAAVWVPLYMPFFLLAAATAWLFYADRRTLRRARAGLCTRCGYDRAGLEAGTPCPECSRGGGQRPRHEGPAP